LLALAVVASSALSILMPATPQSAKYILSKVTSPDSSNYAPTSVIFQAQKSL
jgi:hypothetical protein